jgi:hypothetical protein
MIGRIVFEVQIALAAGEGDRCVLAEHLDGDHHHRLALGRIDLAGRNRGAWLVGWQLELTQAAARPEASQRMSLVIFIKATAAPL